MPRALPIVFSTMLLLIIGCSSTTSVSTFWKTPEPLPPPFKKIVTLLVNASPGERRAGEDELAAQLKPGQGVPGHTLISDDDLKSRDKVRQSIQSQGIDGAIVLRLVAADTATTYYPPSYSSHYGFYDYYDRYASYSPGYSVTDTTVRAEVSIYSVKDERLLWAGASSTTNPTDVKDLVAEVVGASVTELKKQGMIR